MPSVRVGGAVTGLLCQTRPPEWWETGDPGNRLAIGLCRVCPGREECAAGARGEAGVIRAGVAYLERGGVAEICHCGYPDDRRADYRRSYACCRRCAVPRLRNWSRKRYWAEQYKARKAKGNAN